MPEVKEEFKFGRVAFFGRPNAGKSTLLNALMNVDFSATSNRPQTTRQNIKGILQHYKDGIWSGQSLILDTPGINLQRGLLERSMHNQVQEALDQADLCFWIADSKSLQRDMADIELDRGGADKIPYWIAENVKKARRASKWILILNKIDRVGKPDLLPLIERCQTVFPDISDIIPISAIHGKDYARSNVDAVQKVIEANLPVGSPEFPEEMWTELTERKLVENLIREAIFQMFYKEVPYKTECQVIQFLEHENKKLKPEVAAMIWVATPSLKRILVGAQGQKIKEIGIFARKRYEEITGQEIILKLLVKVVNGWDRSTKHLEELGFTAAP
ncbi:GTPase Era [bacterium]|nr:GTPase Era [bacterium]